MHILGKLFLRFMRAFHFWHEHNEEIALALLISGCLAFLLSALGVISIEHRAISFEWEHLLGLVTTIVFGCYLLLRTVGKALARFWPPLVVIGITRLAEPAEKHEGTAWVFEDGRGNRYRYRYARVEDIKVFCRLAMSDPAIVTTYAYLAEKEWQELYARWFDADPHNLMVLEKLHDSDGGSNVSAVSIVVPLIQRRARLMDWRHWNSRHREEALSCSRAPTRCAPP